MACAGASCRLVARAALASPTAARRSMPGSSPCPSLPLQAAGLCAGSLWQRRGAGIARAASPGQTAWANRLGCMVYQLALGETAAYTCSDEHKAGPAHRGHAWPRRSIILPTGGNFLGRSTTHVFSSQAA